MSVLLCGQLNLCEGACLLASHTCDGTSQRFICVDHTQVHPLPSSITFQQAALLEPLSVGVDANGKAQVKAGDNVLILGAGPCGIVCVMVAKASGAKFLNFFWKKIH